MHYKVQQAEMIYLSLIHTLKAVGIEYSDQFESLSDDLLERHEAVHLLDLLDDLYDFITSENAL